MDSLSSPLARAETPAPVGSSPRVEQKAVFVVTQINHIDRVHQLADQLGLTDVEVVIVFTKKNMSMPLRTQAAVDPRRGWRVRLHEIHVDANKLSLAAAERSYTNYQRLLDEVKPDKLLVCSYERHYALLLQAATERGIETVYFEEGTSVYKSRIKGYETFRDPDWKHSIFDIYNSVWADQPIFRFVFYPIYVALKQLYDTPRLVYRSVEKLYRSSAWQRRLLKRRFPAFLNSWTSFDEFYGAEPSLVEDHFSWKHSGKFLPQYVNEEEIDRAKAAIEAYDIDSNTAIFCSQPMSILPATIAPIMLQLLNGLTIRFGYRIAIKLHPREGSGAAAVYSKLLVSYGLDNIFILPPNLPAAEYLAIYSESPAVVSMSSSVLVYAPIHKPSLKAISVGDALLHELAKSKIKNQQTAQLKNYIRILDVIPHIEQYDPGEAHPSR
ncbi:polysialyltransferase family glycosyltransferase [Rhizobium sp. NFR12]|uniref:polysialyltransferase family glycosyltransferase n=1 Tax=Rhizobium sp. NFR12 TaxID=1566261 RepID=UPI0008A752B2|nr:polysialyltransferase family glycosyltransferase [Rhizobium sp. NFR12]SEH27940.1 Alpha-2,8-polysialyltransferase (POLYST) [Rhizobium sp. NFR12]